MAGTDLTGRHCGRSGQRSAEAGSVRERVMHRRRRRKRREPMMACDGTSARYYSAEGQQPLLYYVFRPSVHLFRNFRCPGRPINLLLSWGDFCTIKKKKRKPGVPCLWNISTQWQLAAAAVFGEFLYNPSQFGTSHVNGLQSSTFLPGMYLSTGYNTLDIFQRAISNYLAFAWSSSEWLWTNSNTRGKVWKL
jgi:hypothetical protein